MSTNYKTCDKCCYDILDSDGDVMEHYCFENEVYIDFMNKDNGFKTERKYFKTYEDAHVWALDNFDKFNHDMISYTEYEKPIKN